jgi:hypothetical protein
VGCRRGCLVGLLGVLLALALLLDGSDILARHFATNKIAERIRAREPSAQGVSVHIRSFPFLKVVIDGHVDEVGARFARITVGPLAFIDVDVELHGLRVQRGSLFSQGEINVTGVRQGTVSATLTASALSQAVGVPVIVTQSGVTVRGLNVTPTIQTSTRHLVIGGLQSFALPGPDVLPCLPVIGFSGQAITLSCTFTQVPSAFASLGT